MKLKCRKINNVDKSICTAEQKIAYNYAFSYAEFGKKILKTDTAEINKSDGFFQIENLVVNDIKNRDDMKKYNIDAIIIAFRNGFRKYCEKSFVASDYETIGKCFEIPYSIT